MLIKYYSGNKMKEDERSVACDSYGEEGRCIHGLVGRAERKRPLTRPKRKWGIILKLVLKK